MFGDEFGDKKALRSSHRHLCSISQVFEILRGRPHIDLTESMKAGTPFADGALMADLPAYRKAAK
jgi:hypothetical protein